MTISAADAALIEQSLELAAEREGDLTGRVYALLFARDPATEAQFVRDTDGAIKGEMLARVLDAVLDFISERRYAPVLIQCEVITHDGYDVPPRLFMSFFGIVAEAVAGACGATWTPAMGAAWRRLLDDIDACAAQSAPTAA